MKKKDFAKFTKRNVHKRRSKEAAKRELMRAVRECGVAYDGVKIKESYDSRLGGRGLHRSEDILTRGIFSGSKSSYGFVSPEEGGDDIFIPGGSTHGAIHGDFVEIIYHKYKNRDGEDKTEGRVTRIIEVGSRTVIGVLSEESYRHGRRYIRHLYIQPDDPKNSLRPSVSYAGSAMVGDKVEALIRRDGSSNPSCEIIRVFGDNLSREANYAAILTECGITSEFTPDELALAEQVASQPLSLDGRRDFTSDTVFTIDGESAKDLDDAVSLRRLPGGGWRLGVHIADVSHYVTERTALDRCVMQRGTSVYFTDKVVPMLPEALSNGACSLNAGENKYTLSALIDLDAKGEISSVKLYEAVINSKVRGVYSEVNALFSGDADASVKKKYSSVLPTLTKMRELYLVLLEKSKGRGAIDFDADEAVILLGTDGMPVAIEKRDRGIAERMIEQFMLTANEAVATLLTEKGIPCVYRVHEAPPPDGYADFLNYLESLGFDVRELRKKEPTPAALSSLLEVAEGRGMGDAVSYTMLRAMAKAKYSEQRQAHFGLGIENYCHFTSPIRRLSDLATHRIIKKVLIGDKRPDSFASYARRAAAAATEGELRAVNAERRIEDLYKVMYMSEHIGEVYPAKISSITSFGIFCMLENTCEGLIPISTLPGVFSFDERNLTMRSSTVTYHIADEIFISVEEASVTRGKLRFAISEQKDN